MKKSIVYIIGVDHLVQYRNGIVSSLLFNEFQDYIAEIIRNYNITTVAEEFNREYLYEVYFSTEAIVESAAVKAGVAHIFCDPGEADRLRLGIPYFADIKEMIKNKYGISDKLVSDINMHKKIYRETVSESKKYWAIREEFWYGTLPGIGKGNILFICGHEHVHRFAELLISKGRSAEVIEPFWRSEIFSDYSRLGIS